MVNLQTYCVITQFKADEMQRYITSKSIPVAEIQNRHIEILNAANQVASNRFQLTVLELIEIDEFYKKELAQPKVQAEFAQIMNANKAKTYYGEDKISQAQSIMNNPFIRFFMRLFIGKEKTEAVHQQINQVAEPAINSNYSQAIKEENQPKNEAKNVDTTDNSNNNSLNKTTMITIEKYALLSAHMAAAMNDRQLQIDYCKANGITIEDWDAGSAHYIQMMMNPAESGKVIAAMTSVAMSGQKAIDPRTLPKEAPKPQSFEAVQAQAWVADGIQQVLFKNNNLYIQFQLNLHPDPNDEFLSNYVRGRVHITINAQDYSIYGGVSSVTMERDSLLLKFDDEGIERMGMTEMKVNFTLHAKKFNQIRYVMAGIYGNTFQRNSLPDEPVFSINNVEYNLTWANFNTGDWNVSIRPNLQNFKEKRTYNLVAMPKYMLGKTDNPEMELKMFQHALDAWVIYFEMDLTSIVTMIIKTPTFYQVYIYSSLSQNDFMARMNESSAFTPAIPLDFAGGEDVNWENYTNCLNDYNSKK